MKKLTALATALSLAAPTALAQLQAGDLVLTYPSSVGSSVEGYGAGGAVNLSFNGGESSWISSALMPDGRIVVHNNNGLEQLVFFTATGALQSSFQVSVPSYASDIDTYTTGEIAMCSRGEGIRIYNDGGALLTTFAPPEMMNPMGCQTQLDGTIWVADLMNFPANPDGRLLHLDGAGALISYIDVPFDASDVALAPDGSIWVVGRESEVAHYQQNGTLITQWNAIIDSSLKSTWSLAVDGTGSVWISGHYDSKVRSYDGQGNMLSEFDTTVAGNSTFSFMMPGSNWIRRYCFGDGSSVGCPCANNVSAETGCASSLGTGATLHGTGSPDALMDNLNFIAQGLVPNQPVLLFSADNEVTPAQPAFLFGDGFRCAGGNIERLGVTTASAGGDAAWGPGLASSGGWGPGDVQRFQAWYRDPVGSPCGTAFNLSNGVEVNFLP